MSREEIKDRYAATLGYIETMPDGKQKALDKYAQTLGYYDPKRNVTLDEYQAKTLATGNVLSGLIYQHR
jgi:hypothetical protein